jgi:hypothetical protein
LASPTTSWLGETKSKTFGTCPTVPATRRTPYLADRVCLAAVSNSAGRIIVSAASSGAPIGGEDSALDVADPAGENAVSQLHFFTLEQRTPFARSISDRPWRSSPIWNAVCRRLNPATEVRQSSQRAPRAATRASRNRSRLLMSDEPTQGQDADQGCYDCGHGGSRLKDGVAWFDSAENRERHRAVVVVGEDAASPGEQDGFGRRMWWPWESRTRTNRGSSRAAGRGCSCGWRTSSRSAIRPRSRQRTLPTRMIARRVRGKEFPHGPRWRACQQRPADQQGAPRPSRRQTPPAPRRGHSTSPASASSQRRTICHSSAR